MTCKNRLISAFLGFVTATTLISEAHAVLVNVAYDGVYDEAISAPGGDYNNLGGAADVGTFDLKQSVAGYNNIFHGSVATPYDSTDFFVIHVADDASLTGASIQFGTNLSIFNPLAISAPPPHWVLEDGSSPTPTVFDIAVAEDDGVYPRPPQQTSALTYTPTFSALGGGYYNVLLGNGTFAANNGPVAYTMIFTVTGPEEVSAVPLPAALPLYGAGIAVLGLVGWRKKKKQSAA